MRTSLGWPITLAVVMIVLLVSLLVGWILLTVPQTYKSDAYWAIFAVGTLFLVLILAGVVMYLLISIKGVRLTQRQSNFIDSVTHELKSPIASLKLYLQTLSRRQVSEREQQEFHRFMLKDVERLDTLINHMLDAARLDQKPEETDVDDIDVAHVLRNCAHAACLRYNVPPETVQLEVEPSVVRARKVDVEMVFRNIIENAIKYGGKTPEVLLESHANGSGCVVTRITDNGPGIPPHLRRKIFGRFVRLGSELERSQTGTGLGLFIVRTVVKRLKGKVSVRDRADTQGTVFEIQLPAGSGPAATSL